MKVEGLGDQRRADLFQIRHLVESVDKFSSEQFKKMVDLYKDEDQVMYQILTEATKVADKQYTRYLDNVLVGGRMAAGLLPGSGAGDEAPVFFKVMSEMRERIKNEKEYRRQFLGPQIGRQTQLHEIELRRAQKQEIKQQRDEQRAIGKMATRSGSWLFDFGR